MRLRAASMGQAEHGDETTDGNFLAAIFLAAIFRAAVNGFELLGKPLDPVCRVSIISSAIPWCPSAVSHVLRRLR